MPETSLIVHVENISLRRDGTFILRGIDWTIAAGQHWALLGANGSGKTTLLKVLTGYEWASEGTLSVFGKRFGKCDVRELRKAIGWVSASIQPRIPPQARVLEVVLSGIDAALRAYRDFREAEREHAATAITQMAIAPLADRTFATLSQGEQQRTLIARALVCRPALLILDEPCAGLDPAAREHFLDDLAAFTARPDAPTTVLVTHHIEEVGPWVTHGLALKNGAALASGPIATILNESVVSQMLEASCRVSRANGRYRLDIIPGS